MSYKITNTALDHTKRFLHRTAAKMQMEPVLAGRRLRIRSSMVISDELFEHNKANLELYKKWGVVDWQKVGEEKPAVVEVEPANEPVVPPAEPEKKPESPHEATERLFGDTGLKVPPPAETAPVQETKPQPKSPFKGKKS